MAMSIGRRAGAEFIGTFWLVLGGCGTAVLAAGFPHLGVGFVGVALAFGLTLLTMVYASATSADAISIRRSPSVSLPAGAFLRPK